QASSEPTAELKSEPGPASHELTSAPDLLAWFEPEPKSGLELELEQSEPGPGPASRHAAGPGPGSGLRESRQWKSVYGARCSQQRRAIYATYVWCRRCGGRDMYIHVYMHSG